MAVKQLFETYVYDQSLSSVAQTPFVMTQVNVRHGKACSEMPHDDSGGKRLLSGEDQCGSWLACDAGAAVYQEDRGDAIAGKPAPTEKPARTIRGGYA
ncbi:hypothetical protein QLG25_31465 [Pseudomonas sp. CBR-F]